MNQQLRKNIELFVFENFRYIAGEKYDVSIKYIVFKMARVKQYTVTITINNNKKTIK